MVPSQNFLIIYIFQHGRGLCRVNLLDTTTNERKSNGHKKDALTEFCNGPVLILRERERTKSE
jgi:hypothetical protein